MPGANCSIHGCATGRKHSVALIIKIFAETDELSKETSEAWISVITNDRVVDESLRRQINSGNGYVCEKHFRKEQYECCKHTNSYFNLSNISRLRITSRCATELSGHGP